MRSKIRRAANKHPGCRKFKSSHPQHLAQVVVLGTAVVQPEGPPEEPDTNGQPDDLHTHTHILRVDTRVDLSDLKL